MTLGVPGLTLADGDPASYDNHILKPAAPRLPGWRFKTPWHKLLL